jgi:hypothetical protein
MTIAIEQGLLEQLEFARWPVITGRDRWVLVDMRGGFFDAAMAAGFELERVAGFTGIDFERPANRSALAALVKYLSRHREPKGFELVESEPRRFLQ